MSQHHCLRGITEEELISDKDECIDCLVALGLTICQYDKVMIVEDANKKA